MWPGVINTACTPKNLLSAIWIAPLLYCSLTFEAITISLSLSLSLYSSVFPVFSNLSEKNVRCLFGELWNQGPGLPSAYLFITFCFASTNAFNVLPKDNALSLS